MSRNIHGTILLRRRYSEELHARFARLSGDFNPMHIDPVAARRTLVGGRVVHGLHQVLSALEALLAWSAKHKRSYDTITGFKAKSLKPVLVEEVVVFHLAKLTDETSLITGRISGEIVFWISIQFGTISPLAETDMPPLPEESVADLAFAQLADRTGSLVLGLEGPLVRQMFPLTTARLGTRRMAGILALSRLVGMHCPGLQSIFSETTIRLDGTNASNVLGYHVVETDVRFSRIAMTVQGVLDGEVVAFYRPPPQSQPGMSEVMLTVKPGDFSDSVALIVGGSSGLGEITAKIIAAGGGLSIITYHLGLADAEKTVKDILSNGGRSEMLRLEVETCQSALRNLAKTGRKIRSLYYFATPKIPGRQRGFFSHAMLRKFNEIYVTAFGRLIDAVAETCVDKLRVFYPSSVMVTEGMDKMEEYIMAKRLGEELCSYYNQNSDKIKIMVERLPRLKTDQTSSIIPLPAQDPLEVMLPIVRRMEKLP